MGTGGTFVLSPPNLTPSQQAYFEFAQSTFPSYMAEDPEFQVFLYLIAMLTGEIQDDINNFTNLIDLDNCPPEFLPLLAGNIGYKYDYSKTVEENIFFLKNYIALKNIRGSKLAIQLATIYGFGSTLTSNNLFSVSVLPYPFQYNIPDPTQAPIVGVVSQSTPVSTLPPGIYYVGYTYVSSSGETNLSPLSEIQISLGQSIGVFNLTSPKNTSINIYVSQEPGSSFLYLSGNTTGSTYYITSIPTGQPAPAMNTTGTQPVVVNNTTYTGPGVYLLTLPYFITELPSSVYQVNPAGFLPVIHQSLLSTDSIVVSDQLEPNLQTAKWTWGNFTWGEFTWGNQNPNIFFVGAGSMLKGGMQ